MWPLSSPFVREYISPFCLTWPFCPFKWPFVCVHGLIAVFFICIGHFVPKMALKSCNDPFVHVKSFLIIVHYLSGPFVHMPVGYD